MLSCITLKTWSSPRFAVLAPRRCVHADELALLGPGAAVGTQGGKGDGVHGADAQERR